MKYDNIKALVIFFIISIPLLFFGGRLVSFAFETDYIQLFELIFGLILFVPGLLFLVIVLINFLPFPTRQLTEIETNLDKFEKDFDKNNNREQLGLFGKLLFGFFSIASLTGSYFSYQNRNEILDNENTKMLTITLKEQPEMRGKHDNISNLITNEYPSFKFRFDGFYQDILNDLNFVNKVHIGDTLNILIRESDYKMKIIKTNKPGILDKYFEWEHIDIFGVATTNKVFYDLSSHHGYKKHNWNLCWYLLGLGLLGLLAIFLPAKKPKNRPDANIG